MTGINDISAYSQASQAYATGKATASEKTSTAAATASAASKWSAIDSSSSLVPTKTEYGYTIGDVQLSDKAAKYLEQLKSKFHNMEFITVSSSVKDQVQANAGSYGNSSKTVVLIDEEKLEKMATDENFRKKYEGIIASASAKLTQAQSSLASSGASVGNFGMSVDSNGNEKFFAVLKKSSDAQKERIEKKAEQKKEEKVAEKKKAAKKEKEEQLEELRNKFKDDDYEIIESDSFEKFLSEVAKYSYANAESFVQTEAELSLGTAIDFKG